MEVTRAIGRYEQEFACQVFDFVHLKEDFCWHSDCHYALMQLFGGHVH
jgi:hypothetical protein